MIVIEGPDGSGKTTLVGQLLERFPQLKLGERTGQDADRSAGVLGDSLHAMARAVRHTPNVYIWDRLWPSELVYAKVFGRECSISPNQVDLLVRLDHAARWPLIVCLPPIDVVKTAVANSNQMEGVADKIEGIYNAYCTLGQENGYMIYNWARPGRFNQLLGYIEEYLFVRKERGET